MRKSYSVGIYEKAFPESLSICEMLALAKESGYDFFEINIDRTESRIARVYDTQFQINLEKSVAKTDFPVRSLGLSALSTYTLGNPDEEIAQRGMDIFKQTMLFAERFGIRIVQIPACDVPKFDARTDKTREKFLRNLRVAVDLAEKHGILLGLENMENDFMDSMAKCVTLIDSIDSPYFQLYPDAGNITNAWGNNAESIRIDMDLCKGRSVAFHLKEVQPDRYGGLFYGDGWVDFKTLTRKAYDLGIRRFGMEYWYTGNEKWKEDLVNARKMCDSWICEDDS